MLAVGRAGATPLYVYGRNPVREALGGRRIVKSLIVAVGSTGDELLALLSEGLGKRPLPPVRREPAPDMTSLLQTPDHQGIAAEVETYPYVDAAELLHGHTLIVALDQVQDPQNLGAIIRTAAAAGAGVVIPRHRGAEITGAVVRASAGTTERAAVARVRNLTDFLQEAKKAGFWVYGAAGGSESSYADQDYSYPTCFVMGSEGQGLGRRVETMCDVMVSIPLESGVESLNVSVAAGVLLYEVVRQRSVEGSGRP